jgi:hypothetical protein
VIVPASARPVSRFTIRKTYWRRVTKPKSKNRKRLPDAAFRGLPGSAILRQLESHWRDPLGALEKSVDGTDLRL